jgi:D-glycero-alpha-D-manno-heptose-7-phosphate kinase
MTAIVRASAPVRLDFAGGWTDVSPFAGQVGGLVVNAAISPRMHVEFLPGGGEILVSAADLGLESRITSAADLVPEGPLALHHAALRMFPPGPGTLITHGEVPPGSGLGSSGALDVALIAALAASRGEILEPGELAHLGWQLETVEAGLPGGQQDQYAAALGGFHRLAFSGQRVEAEPLELDQSFLEALEQRILICYSGRSRLSGDTITRVMHRFAAGDPGTVMALHELRQVAHEMAEALEESSLTRVGALLWRNWACQQRLDPVMCTPEMARLEAAVREAGALGGKAAGAGAGGCMFFLMGDDPAAGREAASAAGATILEAGWSATGVELC